MKLIIGNKNYSSWSLRPWLLLSIYDIPFEELRIPLYTEHTKQALAAYTDAGKVPVLHDDGAVVWDSLAICEYVSEQHLDGRGWPAGVAERAEARSCSAEMHSGFFHLRNELPMNCRATDRNVAMTPGLAADIQRIEAMWTGLRRRFSHRGPWLFGEFSIADCMYAPVASRFRTYGVGLPEACAAYVEHLLVSRHMMLWYRQAADERETIDAEEVGR
ncbi:MAG: glutathione S-transferase family protein [Arenicellales bacterium]